MALATPATAADKTPQIVIKPAPGVAKAAQPTRAQPNQAKSDPDQIVCVAGCDSIRPVVVQERPHVAYVEPSRPQWVEQTWGVHCADGLGCIARDVLPMPSRWCCESRSTVIIFRQYWR